MLLLPLLYRHRTAFLWVGLLFLAAVLGRVDAERWQLPSGIMAPAAEEATPDSVSPALPAPAGWERARHLARLGVSRWHTGGHRGQGVKVAVLDSGFRGYRGQLGKALPAQVRARSFRVDGNL